MLNQLSTIETIADRCPEEAGIAVFKARNLFVQIAGFHKREWENCNPEFSTAHQEERANLGIVPKVKIAVFPSPANDEIQIICNETGKRYTICNVLGQVIATDVLKNNNTSFSTISLQSGIYYLKIEDNPALKFAIQH